MWYNQGPEVHGCKHLAMTKVNNILKQREVEEYQVTLLNGYANPGWGPRESPNQTQSMSTDALL